MPAETLLQQALALHRQSRFSEAQVLYERIVQADPRQSNVWYLLGHIAGQSGQNQRALDLLGNATRYDPLNAAAHNETGNVLFRLDRFDEAIAAYRRAVGISANSAEFHTNLGGALCSLKRFDEALASFDAALGLDSKTAGGHFNRGLALYELGRYRAAVEAFDRAIAIDPAHARAHNYKGHALHGLCLNHEALQSYDRAIAQRADYADAHNGRGTALLALEEYPDALLSFDAAIALQPAYADAHNNRGNALRHLGRHEAALSSYERALSIQPGYAGVSYNRGHLLAEMGRHAEAVADLERALTLNPDLPYARGDLLLARMQICEWRDHDIDVAQLILRVGKGEPAATPFCMLTMTDSPALQMSVAQSWIERNAMPARPVTAEPHRSRGKKIRVGYFSADFREHPVSRLAAELFELHDRSRFEVFAFSFGPDTRDKMRQRLEHAFDRFIDVREKSAAEIVSLARQLEVDIAVDLTGLTKHCRPNIFALRAAPLQVSYLGYLGTMGAAWIDYLIADRTLIPERQRQHYAERIAYLPSYQANDSKRMAAKRHFERHELGLPVGGFVFCCCNAGYKITPGVFGSWMRILERVPGAVLMVYVETTTAGENLRKEALDRGIATDRIVLAGRLATADYLARYRSADLFLDTFPYNGGTTASDALWAGLPVLTRSGETFSSRMAASLLATLGIVELITSSAAQYEDLAVALATQPDRMVKLKQTLAVRLAASPLFDARRHTLALERAYSGMHARHEAGLPPVDIIDGEPE